MKPAANAKSGSLEPPDGREWNFDAVGDDEIELCFLYEYGRQARGFKKTVADWRAAYPQIVAAARNLLNRKGPVGFTIGPTVETRKEAAFFAAPNKALTKADKRKADENGKAWVEWIKTSWQGGYPGQFPLDDPRVFLFYFPPFPKKRWQEIGADCRRHAPLLLDPNLLFSGRLRSGGNSDDVSGTNG